ncbi:hypothetical protein SAY86_000003 [Trapa natans]|uniref:Transcription initiation factor TFIID component TAF4 C-terminal domain-containing protein n=1 Tax=Trapa natans TaxID=22666 RepID=A0AAN7RG89_TRANT|nr:hypothetical protein SAY86_000003 [Trapa natans]
MLQSGVHKMEIQVPTPTSKHHTESVVEIQGEPPSMNLPYQRVGAQETSAAPYLHERVHPLKEKIAPRLIDTGRTMNNHLYTPTTPSPAAMSRSPFQENNHVCQKKPLDNPDSASQPLRKKQKTSVPSDDQSIEQLIDVTAVSGVNLKEEEEQLLSGPKEDYRVSEASLRALQEEESLILQKVPLQKKMTEIMTKCGMNNVGKDVERCLSQAVEERLQGLLYSLIRFSKQRIDNEKHMHKIVITSDIRQHIMTLNRLAKEELEKEGEAEKGRKICERESNDGPDDKKEKDEGRGKLRKANKQEDDKMRTTNFAARAAVGGADLLSKWQLMAEQAQQIRGESQVGSKPSFPLASGVARRSGRNQMAAPQPGLSRSISVKDMISVLERETQMSKSTLIYNLYNRVPSNPAPSNT